MRHIPWDEIDVDAWPRLAFAGRTVVLEKGHDFICALMDPIAPGSVTIFGIHGHVHIVTMDGVAKLAELMDSDDLRALAKRRQAQTFYNPAPEPRDPERVAFRTDVDRLKRVHREGNG